MSKDTNSKARDADASLFSALEKYKARFPGATMEEVECSEETGLKLPHIVTNRFTLKPMYQLCAQEMKELYTYTFGSPEIMCSFGDGRGYGEAEFERIVSRNHTRWQSNYPFSSFVVTHNEGSEDKEYDVVVGFEGLNDYHDKPGACQLGYALNKKAQSLGKAGSETTGALVLIYGQYLFDTKALVNRSDSNREGSTGSLVYEGEVLNGVYATVRQDNKPSLAILKGLGFEDIGVVTRYGAERFELQRGFCSLDYEDDKGSVCLGEQGPVDC
jgi:RimJ/RimL family protein N-acetyltransferase